MLRNRQRSLPRIEIGGGSSRDTHERVGAGETIGSVGRVGGYGGIARHAEHDVG
jgi:hypothetical protein